MFNIEEIKKAKPIYWKLLGCVLAVYVICHAIFQSILISKIVSLEHEMSHLVLKRPICYK